MMAAASSSVLMIDGLLLVIIEISIDEQCSIQGSWWMSASRTSISGNPILMILRLKKPPLNDCGGALKSSVEAERPGGKETEVENRSFIRCQIYSILWQGTRFRGRLASSRVHKTT